MKLKGPEISVQPNVRSGGALLSPVDRASELIFGLLMAISIIGAASIGSSGPDAIRAMFVAALGCNLAWGIVDATMYLVRTLIERRRSINLFHAVRAATSAEVGREIIRNELSDTAAAFMTSHEIDVIRNRILKSTDLQYSSSLTLRDFFAATAIFALVVASTFPVVMPFAFTQNVNLARHASQVIAVVSLFLCGFTLGRYALGGGWRSGLAMAGVGLALVSVIEVLGG